MASAISRAYALFTSSELTDVHLRDLQKEVEQFHSTSPGIFTNPKWSRRRTILNCNGMKSKPMGKKVYDDSGFLNYTTCLLDTRRWYQTFNGSKNGLEEYWGKTFCQICFYLWDLNKMCWSVKRGTYLVGVTSRDLEARSKAAIVKDWPGRKPRPHCLYLPL